MNTSASQNASFLGALQKALVPVLVTMLTGVMLWATPLGQGLERQYGLHWAFAVRGDITAPKDVVYIPLNEQSAQALRQPPVDINVKGWDRGLFADLVDRLSSAGASAIVFDIMFEESTEGDAQFASAMRRAGNVLLLSWLTQTKIPLDARGQSRLHAHQLHSPPSLLANAAAATPPMLIRKDRRADRFHVFSQPAGHMTPNLPVIALFLHHQARVHADLKNCPDYQQIIENTTAPLTLRLTKLRRAMLNNIANTSAPEGCRPLHESAFGHSLTGSVERYFNFYGHAGTLATLPLHRFLSDQASEHAAQLQGKVVFIGVADQYVVNPPDIFSYVLDEQGIGGVELISTALANLLHQQDIRPIGNLQGTIIIGAFALILGWVLFRWPRQASVPLAALVSLLYLGISWSLFAQHNLWLPSVIPVLVEMPLMLALVWLSRLSESERLSDTLTHFVSRGMRKKLMQETRLDATPELLYGVCMHTDVAGYTALSERFSSNPMYLKQLEKDYWAMLDSLVAQHQGERLEISGDGMLAVWADDNPSPNLFNQAVDAAQAIDAAIQAFNKQHPEAPFHTRIGLHAGPVALGLVGGEGHYTLTLGGDVANTAARLENDINKLLGTKVLISEAIVKGAQKLDARPLGHFIPRGKSQAIAVYDISTSHDSTATSKALEDALSLLQAGHIEEAREHFGALHSSFPDDSPCAFYKRLLNNQAFNTPVQLDEKGVIDLNPSVTASHHPMP